LILQGLDKTLKLNKEDIDTTRLGEIPGEQDKGKQEQQLEDWYLFLFFLLLSKALIHTHTLTLISRFIGHSSRLIDVYRDYPFVFLAV